MKIKLPRLLPNFFDAEKERRLKFGNRRSSNPTIMSFILSQILKKKVSFFNERVFSEEDFFTVCEQTDCSVIESPIRSKGEYAVYKNRSFIIFRKGLKNPLRLWVGLHEMGHHLLHYPVNHRFSRSTVHRLDREANFFAAIALMPTDLIKRKTLEEIIEEYGYPREIVLIRKDIFDNFRM